ncbi:MAG: hypothetical protein HY287_09815 [Planctomycetes bacterium]|nr:hypothetical protein [Planctomycetota bacterium]MBI3834610.1 hypothetical protein [Planctomycetota bacterium]
MQTVRTVSTHNSASSHAFGIDEPGGESAHTSICLPRLKWLSGPTACWLIGLSVAYFGFARNAVGAEPTPSRTETVDGVLATGTVEDMRFYDAFFRGAVVQVVPPKMPAPTSQAIDEQGRVVASAAMAAPGVPARPTETGNDGPVQAAPGFPQPLAPPLQSTFGAVLDDDTNIPPDTVGAVGPNHLVVLINTGFTVQNRLGVVVSPQVSLSAFWSALGTAAGQPASVPFDPRVFYDQYAGRWVAASLGNPQQRDGTNNAWLLVAISQTNDPTGTWNFYAIHANNAPTHTTDWADFTEMGVDPNNVIVTVNMFNTVGNFVHADVWIINKASMIAGPGPLVQGTDYALIHNPCGTGGFSYAPVLTFGQTPGTAASYLVNPFWIDNATQTRRFFRVNKITGTGASAVLACNGGNDFIEVAKYNFNMLDAPQSSCATGIASNDSRLSIGTLRNGHIFITHAVGSGAGTPAIPPSKPEVAWYEINPATAGAFPGGAPVQQGRVSDPNLYYIFPSIAVNANGEVALGFSGSSSSTFAGAYYTAHCAGGAAGTMQTVAQLKAGVGPYLKTFGGTENRWGDYSATAIDPLDDSSFWTLQEYAAVQFSGGGGTCTLDFGRWGTWWGSFTCCPSAAAPFPQAPFVVKNRYISIVPGNAGLSAAIRVKLVSSNTCPISVGDIGWVGLPNANGDALLEPAPFYMDWSAFPVVHIGDDMIFPDSIYEIQMIAQTCDVGSEGNFSVSLSLPTMSFWGNVVGSDEPPNITDVARTVDNFKLVPGAPTTEECDLVPGVPDRTVNISDVAATVDGFKGLPFPFPCP